MTPEEIKNEILAKLPAEIVEKIKGETITEDEVKEFILPLYKQFTEMSEGSIVPLAENLLDAVTGGGWTKKVIDWFKEKLSC